MKVREFGEITPDSAQKIRDSLVQIKPGLSELSKRLDEGESSDTGDLRMILSSKGYDHPSTKVINKSLGFLAYNNIIELEEDTVWMGSNSTFNEFYLDNYDEDIYDQAVNYLDSRLSEIDRFHGEYSKSPHDFDSLDLEESLAD